MSVPTAEKVLVLARKLRRLTEANHITTGEQRRAVHELRVSLLESIASWGSLIDTLEANEVPAESRARAEAWGRGPTPGDSEREREQ